MLARRTTTWPRRCSTARCDAAGRTRVRCARATAPGPTASCAKVARVAGALRALGVAAGRSGRDPDAGQARGGGGAARRDLRTARSRCRSASWPAPTTSASCCADSGAARPSCTRPPRRSSTRSGASADAARGHGASAAAAGRARLRRAWRARGARRPAAAAGRRRRDRRPALLGRRPERDDRRRRGVPHAHATPLRAVRASRRGSLGLRDERPRASRRRGCRPPTASAPGSCSRSPPAPRRSSCPSSRARAPCSRVMRAVRPTVLFATPSLYGQLSRDALERRAASGRSRALRACVSGAEGMPAGSPSGCARCSAST